MPKLNRRQFLGASSAAVAWAGLSLVGCGSGENPVPSLTSTPSGSQTVVVQGELLAFDLTGTSYRLNLVDFTVARLNENLQTVWQVGGLGDGTGLFNFPVALGSDGQGFLYVADRGNGEVDVLDEVDGSLVRTFGQGLLFAARDLAVDAQRERIYVADSSNHRIAVFDLGGALLTSFGEFGTDNPEQLNFPSGVDVAPNGEVHVVDSGNGHVQVFSPDGAFIRVYGSFGGALGQFQFPRSVVVASTGESFVADGVDGFVTRFDSSGAAIDRFQPTMKGVSVQPLYLSISPSDLLVVSGVTVLS